MPSTYTSLLRLTLPADGELIGTWGQVVNNGITTLEESAIAGTSAIALADANRTLTTANGATDEARNMVLSFTGALTAQRDIIVPTSSKIYFVRNATTGGFGLNVKTSAGSGVVVPNGSAMLVYCNGTNVVAALSTISGSGQFLLADGTAAAPSLSFTSDTNTGIYWVSADALGFSTAGTARALFDGNGSFSILPPTNAASPSVAIQTTSGAFGIDIRGRASDDLAVIRLLKQDYTVSRCVFQCDNANGYIGTAVALPFTIITSGVGRLAIAAGGDVTIAQQLYAPNYWVGTATTSAGSFGVANNNGASVIAWGDAAAGAGRLDLYTGSGPAMIFPAVASSVNYVELYGGAAASGPSLKAAGSDTNVQFNYYGKGTGIHAFWANNAAQFVVQAVASAANFVLVGGAVTGANPYIAPSGGLGIRFPSSPIQVIGSGRPWSGSVTESQSYLYNVALGVCNATAAANSRIHEWYKDATALYGLWISDDQSAAAQWLKATGGQGVGTSSIDLTATAINLQSTTGGVVITSTATSNGALVVSDTGAAGANIKLVGNGATTPNKFIRVTGGEFQIISSAYATAPLTLTDAGVMTDIRGLTWGRDFGTVAGTTMPVGSFCIGFISGFNLNALSTVNAATNNITVYGMGSGANTTITTGTWRTIGALSSSANTGLWIRTA